MALGDIIHVMKRSTVGEVEAYTHWHIQEGIDFPWLRSQGAMEMDRWNYFDPMGEGGRLENRTLQLTYTWIVGADAGRHEQSNLWEIPNAAKLPSYPYPLIVNPVIALFANGQDGLAIRRNLYPFNPGTWNPEHYDPYYNGTQNTFWDIRAAWYTHGIGVDRVGKNCGRYVLWSPKRQTWGLVHSASYRHYISTQERRRHIP